ncbi:hypothetical protein D3C75_158780 [compost metagenome]
MLSVKRCTNPECGWEYPLSYEFSKCRFCRYDLDYHKCTDCGTWKHINDFYMKVDGYKYPYCKKCSSVRGNAFKRNNPEWTKAYDQKYAADRRAEAERIYEDWLASTQVPFKPMTEDEWLQACIYFNGCALCGSPHIEARHFFVLFEKGGRYAPWNMFPVCGACGYSTRRTENPFIWIQYQNHVSEERKDRLINYFVAQIEKVRDSNDQK